MTSAAAAPSRAAHLRASFDRQVQLLRRMFDPRLLAVDVGAFVAVAVVGLLGQTVEFAIWWGVVVLLAGVFAWSLYRRHRVRSTVAEYSTLLLDDPSDVEWDRTGVSELPAAYLEPEDVDDAAALERLLVPTSEDRAAAKAAGAPLTSAYLFLLVSTVGVVIAAAAAVVVVGGALLGRDANGWFVLAVVAAMPLFMPLIETNGYAIAMRTVMTRMAARVERRLPHAWHHDSRFPGGRAVQRTDDGYTLNARYVRAGRRIVAPFALVPVATGITTVALALWLGAMIVLRSEGAA